MWFSLELLVSCRGGDSGTWLGPRVSSMKPTLAATKINPSVIMRRVREVNHVRTGEAFSGVPAAMAEDGDDLGMEAPEDADGS
jgi:hypothetical protein